LPARATYTATLSVREEAVLSVSALLHAEQLRYGTRADTRSLSCFKQVVVLGQVRQPRRKHPSHHRSRRLAAVDLRRAARPRTRHQSPVGLKRVRRTTAVDEATGRLATNATDTENQSTPNSWVERLAEVYGYTNAGTVTAIKENSGGALVANQCFKYDALQELTEAWSTTAAACQSTPSQGIVGGPEAYWASYSYDTLSGNRATEVRHASGGNTTRTYAYPNHATLVVGRGEV
jgi:hypothetical protein